MTDPAKLEMPVMKNSRKYIYAIQSNTGELLPQILNPIYNGTNSSGTYLSFGPLLGREEPARLIIRLLFGFASVLSRLNQNVYK